MIKEFASAYSTSEIIYGSYLLLINFSSFILVFIDKRKAEKKEWRIKEVSLLLMALAGGGAGVLIGMVLLKHKTHKKKFTMGIPCIYLLNQIMHLLIYYSLRQS
ncbi:protein of unknown function DUF1294 [Alkaliphilus metalliredigens QYMF]|uniref:DUF1294 domain-containing protein n=1 Tax=Alkaliphilus metalliredigens (strain QYMF) TaxID=293826 RepID=A6TU27_ALKMQ|nr:DUF1294 domain-containing protein [Alkaliphilus metalliredigens]ABR49695.1 protein of unknown function DUF1294 [Alkaliphilus metalliredigens QYMF]